jgi:excisionase family DNA binding protein
MATRGHIGARAGRVGGAADDDLTRLVRLIARQAAQEAFNLFRDALETSVARARPASDAHAQQEAAAEVTADKALQSPESGERFLSVAEVAVRLDVSEKTVRRKIASGDLPARRVGTLLRIGERDLAAYLARARARLGKYHGL